MAVLGREVLSIDSDKQKIAAPPDGRSGRSAWCVHRVSWTWLGTSTASASILSNLSDEFEPAGSTAKINGCCGSDFSLVGLDPEVAVEFDRSVPPRRPAAPPAASTRCPNEQAPWRELSLGCTTAWWRQGQDLLAVRHGGDGEPHHRTRLHVERGFVTIGGSLIAQGRRTSGLPASASGPT